MSGSPALYSPWRRLYGTPRWKRLRRAILAAAGYRCWVAGCERRATEVDHIITPAELHADALLIHFFDTEVLRPSCGFHNRTAAGQVERNRQIAAERRMVAQEAAHEAALAAWAEPPAERRPPRPAIY